MAEPSTPEPVETERSEYSETQPRSERDVERARETDDLLGSSAATASDQSLTGQTHPVDHEEPGEASHADQG